MSQQKCVAHQLPLHDRSQRGRGMGKWESEHSHTSSTANRALVDDMEERTCQARTDRRGLISLPSSPSHALCRIVVRHASSPPSRQKKKKPLCNCPSGMITADDNREPSRSASHCTVGRSGARPGRPALPAARHGTPDGTVCVHAWTEARRLAVTRPGAGPGRAQHWPAQGSTVVLSDAR